MEQKARLSEDWLAVVLGLFLFALSLGLLAGADLLGWAVTTSVWTHAATALGTASKAYSGLPGMGSLILTWLFLLALLCAGAAFLKAN